MLLTELHPKWVFRMGSQIVGIVFDCPCCKGSIRIRALFDNPIGPGPICQPEALHWHREGTEFTNLTLTPSIDCASDGHWHGCITNGVVTNT